MVPLKLFGDDARRVGAAMIQRGQDILFDEFWAVYPRRQGKKDAQKAWAKLKPSPELVEQMLDAIELQRKGRQWRDGFVPLPATWIRGERWLDELDPQRDFYRAKL